MAITVAQVQALLVTQVGDVPDNRLAANVALLWQQAAWAAAIYPPLQGATTRLGLIDLALGYYRTQVDTSMADLSVRYSQRVEHLLELRSTTQDLIARYQALGQAGRTGVQQAITQVTPEIPPDQRPAQPVSSDPDENAEVYQGSPYWPQTRFLG